MDDLEELFANLSWDEAPPADLARRTRTAMMAVARSHHPEPDCRAQRRRRSIPPLAILPDMVLCGPCPVRLLVLSVRRAPAIAGCPYTEAIHP